MGSPVIRVVEISVLQMVGKQSSQGRGVGGGGDMRTWEAEFSNSVIRCT